MDNWMNRLTKTCTHTKVLNRKNACFGLAEVVFAKRRKSELYATPPSRADALEERVSMILALNPEFNCQPQYQCFEKSHLFASPLSTPQADSSESRCTTWFIQFKKQDVGVKATLF